jgi:mono/diheme cytochrome c family protein
MNMPNTKNALSQRISVALLALTMLVGAAHLISSQPALADAALLKQVQSSDASIAEGQKLFLKNNCNSCHGDAGKGDGLAAAALNPKPRNFHANANWKNGTQFAGLYKTLEEGIPGGAMSSFAHVSAKDRVAIIHYIRSLNKSIYPAISEAEVNKLDQDYGLAKGLAAGGKSQIIPVSLAITKLVEEAAGEQQKVEKALIQVRKGTGSDAQLFKSVVYDAERALVLLQHSRNWKTNSQSFAKVAMADAAHNGFKAKVRSLSAQEWQKLFDYLKKLL